MLMSHFSGRPRSYFSYYESLLFTKFCFLTSDDVSMGLDIDANRTTNEKSLRSQELSKEWLRLTSLQAHVHDDEEKTNTRKNVVRNDDNSPFSFLR